MKVEVSQESPAISRVCAQILVAIVILCAFGAHMLVAILCACFANLCDFVQPRGARLRNFGSQSDHVLEQVFNIPSLGAYNAFFVILREFEALERKAFFPTFPERFNPCFHILWKFRALESEAFQGV